MKVVDEVLIVEYMKLLMTIYKFSSFICSEYSNYWDNHLFSFSGSVTTIYKFSVIWILP